MRIFICLLLMTQSAWAWEHEAWYKQFFQTHKNYYYQRWQCKPSQPILLMFAFPDCPLSDYYIRPFLLLSAKYPAVNCKIIIPNKYYTYLECKRWLQKHNVNKSLLTDPNGVLTKAMGISIVPSFVIINHDTIFYKAAFDNYAVSLNQHRQIVTAFYLHDALTSLVNNNTNFKNNTQAVGCVIP